MLASSAGFQTGALVAVMLGAIVGQCVLGECV
eukprot:SAG11_NODE_680_length_7781_cov_6.490497_7_plen_32_part_00